MNTLVQKKQTFEEVACLKGYTWFVLPKPQQNERRWLKDIVSRGCELI